jgi:hypothetical protein
LDHNEERPIFIVKKSGDRERFSEAKLRHSLERALTSPAMIDIIVSHIRNELKEGMTTTEIYRHAFSLLKKHHASTAARYSLKQAILDLGPEGHFFERFVGELVKSKGYSVEVGKILEGFCVAHEVDVAGKKDNYHIMVECKFHNSLGIKSDVKVALYVQARFEDIEKRWRTQPVQGQQKFDEVWLVTNTKLTSDAIRYAACVGMKTIGWSYPEKDSLQVITEQSGLHPLTCLTSLNKFQKRTLLNEGAILCRDLIGKVDLLKSASVAQIDIQNVATEIGELCQIPNLDMR